MPDHATGRNNEQHSGTCYKTMVNMPQYDLILVRYRQAVEHILESFKMDKSVLAVILFGSLAEGTIWEKSDLNITVIVRDDKASNYTYYVDTDNIVVALSVYPRTEFITAVKYINISKIGGCGDSIPIPPGGQMLYCQDDSLVEFLEDLNTVGKADMERALLPYACDMLYYLNRAEKCIRAYNDAMQARLLLLELVKPLAEMELCLNRKMPSKESLMQVAMFNSTLMRRFYEYPMNNVLNTEAVLSLIKEAYEYLDSHLDVICRQLLRFLSDNGEPKRISTITDRFKVNVIYVTEYLSEKEIIDKVSIPISITANKQQVVQEIAYFYETGK